jgi:hypothetical protein
MLTSHPQKRYRCRYCGAMLNAYLPWAKAPNSALLLGHLGQQHMDQFRPYLDRMAAGEAIATVAAEAYEVVE